MKRVGGGGGSAWKWAFVLLLATVVGLATVAYKKYTSIKRTHLL